MKSKIVDCHMHVLNKDEFDIYRKTACADKVINIRGLYIDEMLDPYDFKDFVDEENMFFIDSVDLTDVDKELEKIKKDIKDYPRIIAVKIYLGYQNFFANDKRIFKIAEFASNNNLSVTFHCGEIYDENGESSYSKYSNAKYIEDLAKRFPKINFIASHMNWPGFEEVFSLCNKYDNVYTCFSGCNDGETKEERDSQNELIAKTINDYIKKYPKVKNKIMYGTDFFACSEDYNDVSSYIEVLDLLMLNDKEKRSIIYDNVCKAYNIKF